MIAANKSTEPSGITLLFGDCLERMAEIPDQTIDLIACDLPYGTTACKWDVLIPLQPLWDHYRRVLKPRGAVVLTACQPFTSMLVMSNLKWFREELIWDKVSSSGHLNARTKTLRRHENVLVFSPGSHAFNPQFSSGKPYRVVNGAGRSGRAYRECRQDDHESDGRRHPTSIVVLTNSNKVWPCKDHPTQKPTPLFEHLIRTYSNPGDLVLDNACGSATTLIAAINTGRRCIGIERDPAIFAVAQKRLADHLAATPLLREPA